MKKLASIAMMVWGTLSVSSVGLADTQAVSDINLRKGVTDISGQVYDLHMLMFLICVIIAVVVLG